MDAARIIAETERYYQLEPGSLRQRTRLRDIAWPRQMAMYVIRTELGWSFPRIAREFGLKDHTTVMYGCRRFAERAVHSVDRFFDLMDVYSACRETTA